VRHITSFSLLILSLKLDARIGAIRAELSRHPEGILLSVLAQLDFGTDIPKGTWKTFVSSIPGVTIPASRPGEERVFLTQHAPPPSPTTAPTPPTVSARLPSSPAVASTPSSAMPPSQSTTPTNPSSSIATPPPLATTIAVSTTNLCVTSQFLDLTDHPLLILSLTLDARIEAIRAELSQRPEGVLLAELAKTHCNVAVPKGEWKTFVASIPGLTISAANAGEERVFLAQPPVESFRGSNECPRHLIDVDLYLSFDVDGVPVYSTKKSPVSVFFLRSCCSIALTS